MMHSYGRDVWRVGKLPLLLGESPMIPVSMAPRKGL